MPIPKGAKNISSSRKFSGSEDPFEVSRPSKRPTPQKRKTTVKDTKVQDLIGKESESTIKAIVNKPVFTVDTQSFMFEEKQLEEIKYECTCCGEKKTIDDFYFSMSLATKGRQAMSICKECINVLWNIYFKRFSGETERALYYFCMVIDIPFYKEVAEAAKNSEGTKKSFIDNYISKIISQCRVNGAGSFIDGQMVWDGRNDKDPNFFEIDPEEVSFKPDSKTIRTWGNLPTNDLYYLTVEYEDWCRRYEVRDKAMEQLVKQICYKQLRIHRLNEAGQSNSKELKDLQDLMGSADLKPKDNKGIGAEEETLGTLIKKFENERPIPKPDPVFADVDGIWKKIRIWFLGHFSKVYNLENEYSKEYEQEMAKYRVESKEEYETRSARNLIGGEMFEPSGD